MTQIEQIYNTENQNLTEMYVKVQPGACRNAHTCLVSLFKIQIYILHKSMFSPWECATYLWLRGGTGSWRSWVHRHTIHHFCRVDLSIRSLQFHSCFLRMHTKKNYLNRGILLQIHIDMQRKVKYRQTRAHKSICSRLEHLHTCWGSHRASPRIHQCLSHKTAPLTLQRKWKGGGVFVLQQ